MVVNIPTALYCRQASSFWCTRRRMTRLGSIPARPTILLQLVPSSREIMSRNLTGFQYAHYPHGAKVTLPSMGLVADCYGKESLYCQICIYSCTFQYFNTVQAFSSRPTRRCVNGTSAVGAVGVGLPS